MTESDEAILKRLKADGEKKAKVKPEVSDSLKQKMTTPLGVSDEGELFEVPSKGLKDG